ncbi:MAG: 4-hydroxy-3-methylbut-2-enyl diphosphate reductase [Candidatus Omnitrophota bacterium]
MKITIAPCSGFCFGVKRAISMAQQALEKNKGKRVSSLGHIIHNSQAVERLSQEGLASVKDVGDIEAGVVVISSHGTSPAVLEDIRARGLEIVDATCPYVMSAQRTVTALAQEGYTVIIFGDDRHPEVRSLVGCANGRAIVVKDIEQLRKVPAIAAKIGLVSQTTQAREEYLLMIAEVLTREFAEVRIVNTICNDTRLRQESAVRLARECDVMIVAGGRMSANTKRLFELCSKICKNTYHVETASELKAAWFENKERIGIASGASTPDWVIEEISTTITGARFTPQV